MYIHKKYVRLAAITSCVIAYSCYLSSYDQQMQNNFEHNLENKENSVPLKIFHFLVQEYAYMLTQGTNSEMVHQLIQAKFEDKPELGDKIWQKAQALAAQTPSQAYHAFGMKSDLRTMFSFKL